MRLTRKFFSNIQKKTLEKKLFFYDFFLFIIFHKEKLKVQQNIFLFESNSVHEGFIVSGFASDHKLHI